MDSDRGAEPFIIIFRLKLRQGTRVYFRNVARNFADLI
jgi:hypothetical protein